VLNEQLLAIGEITEFLAWPQLAETKLEDGSGVLLDIEGHQVLSLNEAGMFLVSVLRDGTASTQALVQRLMEQFEVDNALAVNDVEGFLADFSRIIRKSLDADKRS
jgi:Coenzyme PQQ synthesis protein D (PqqD)